MERAGKSLGGMLRGLERPEAALAWLSSAWPNIVGKILAAHTKPVRCQAGRLEIAADGKAWQKQLESMEKEFCARVNQAWGKKISRELDNEHTPFVRRRKS
jgi:predicted nucleic acid-binding Zn ribbon protein